MKVEIPVTLTVDLATDEATKASEMIEAYGAQWLALAVLGDSRLPSMAVANVLTENELDGMVGQVLSIAEFRQFINRYWAKSRAADAVAAVASPEMVRLWMWAFGLKACNTEVHVGTARLLPDAP
jgi:hypothetical protein